MEWVGPRDCIEYVAERSRTAGLVVVRGPAGVGKTRTVREALPDARIVTLSGISEEPPVRQAVAAALGVADDGAGPAIARALSKLGVPLVLDGADRAIEVLRRCLPEWLGADGPTIVVTARGLLGVSGERDVEVEPLPPDAAAELLSASCATHGLTIDVDVALEIAERLDRLPLALEWMAPRAALLGTQTTLQRLRERRVDVDPLTTALDESLDALDDADRDALEVLSAFERGATAAALEAFDPALLNQAESLCGRGLARLVTAPGGGARVTPYRAVADRTRARLMDEGRWNERVRQHAAAVLATIPDAADTGSARGVLSSERAELEAIRERLADSAPEIAARAALLLLPLERTDEAMGPARDRMTELLPKLDDAALRRSARVGLACLERRLGELVAARAHVDEVLAEDDRSVEALLERAQVDRQQSRVDDALRGFEEALSVSRRHGSPEEQCAALGEVGRILQSLGRVTEARTHHVEAIALAKSHGFVHREALERSLHARATHRAGEVRQAIPLHEAALAMHRRLGDRRRAAAERGHLGFCHHELGDLEAAEACFRESIEELAAVGDVALEHIERVLLARLLGDAGRVAGARLELGIAGVLEAALSQPRLRLTHDLVAGFVSLDEGDLARAREELEAAYASGPLFEVGYEALLPAWLGWVVASTDGRDEAEALFARAAELVGRLEHAGLRATLDVLAGAARGLGPPDIDPELAASCSDLRRAIRLTAAPRGGLAVAEDGRRFRLPDGTQVDLGRRSVPRRLLMALVEARRASPGTAVDRETLIEAGWPGERMRPDAADKRLRTAIWTLRKAGLEGLLLTQDDGYLLDAAVPIDAL